MRVRILLTAALLAVTTACSSGSKSAPEANTEPISIGDLDQAPADDSLTRTTFDLTWSQASDVERDAYCMSVALLGPTAAADEMQTGAGGNDSLDWDLMAELLQTECDLR